MKGSTLKTLEETVLLAILEGEDDEATKLLGQMLPGERQALRAAAIKLQRLASRDLGKPASESASR